MMQSKLMERYPLLDEIVVIDSGSTDRTIEIAQRLGAPVIRHPDILHQYGTWTGKGEARRFEGEGMCFIETGGGRAGMGSGNFYAEPLPEVRLREAGLLWHGAKVLYEKYWLWSRF